MTSSVSLAPAAIGQTIMYLLAGLVVQTLFFGAYTVIIFLSTRMLMRRGLKARVNRILLTVTLFMYMLSASYWTYCFVDLVNRIQTYIENPQGPTAFSKWLVLFNALIFVNYILSDAIVIWRARLICSPEHRKYLYFPLLLMMLAALCVTGVIALRVVTVSDFTTSERGSFVKAINMLQISGLTMSLVSNVSATGVVGITAWRHRQIICDGFNRTTKGNNILRLLLESGVFYCLSAMFVLASSLIRLPYNTLGDLYGPVHLQIAGAYTPIVLLLVSMQRSLSDTSFLGTVRDSFNPTSFQFHISGESPAGPNRPVSMLSMQFAARSQVAVADVDPEVAGLQAKHDEKGHRYNVSEATLVTAA